jgi:hypothetical protein
MPASALSRVRPQRHVFRPGALGGGGYVCDMSISDDGVTKVVSTDVYGFYKMNNSTGKWEQMLSAAHFPVSVFVPMAGGSGYNTCEVKVAPSNSRRIYALTPGGGTRTTWLWRSDDAGDTWYPTTTSYTFGVAQDQSNRLNGPGLAVDPNNPDVVYIGDNAGIFHRTFDGGRTFERIASLTAALYPLTLSIDVPSNSRTLTFASVTQAIRDNRTIDWHAYDLTNSAVMGDKAEGRLTASTATTLTTNFLLPSPRPAAGDTILIGSKGFIEFDRSSGTTNGRTNKIYFAWNVNASLGTTDPGVWQTTNAGSTFSVMTGSPQTAERIHCTNDGVLFFCSTENITQNIYRYMSGTWTKLTGTNAAGPATTNNWHGVTSDPQNAGRICAITNQGNLNRSDDYGTTWYGWYSSAPLRVATDIPWLAYTNEDSMSAGNIVYDPVATNKVWFVEGIGIWTTNPPASSARPTWTSVTEGNEELIVNDILHPPGTTRFLCAQHDRGVIGLTSPTTFASHDGPRASVFGQAIIHGWSIDYAKSDPTYIAGIFNGGTSSDCSGYTTDYGETWTQFTTKAGDSATTAGGCLAVSTPNNIVWFPANERKPSYTLNGGVTWALCDFAGTNVTTGWSNSFLNNRHIVCADPIAANTFYAWNAAQVDTVASGFWKSTDGGATWTKLKTLAQLITETDFLQGMGDNAKLSAVPGFTGHLFFHGGVLPGQGTHPYSGSTVAKLAFSTDGGANWTKITTAVDTWNYAFGKAAPGKAYPTIYALGYFNTDTVPYVYKWEGDAPSSGMTWTKIGFAPADVLDDIQCMSADPNTYGTLYLGGACGYIYGKLE